MCTAMVDAIIVPEMGEWGDEHRDISSRERVAECHPDKSPITVAVFADPIVGKALASLLAPCRYDARLVPAVFSSSGPGSLEGVRVVLLDSTSGLSPSRRDALLDPLREEAMNAGIPILELGSASQEQTVPGCSTVPWPWCAEEWEWRIEAALCTDCRAHSGTPSHPPIQNGKSHP
jgi:hypothetical protein